MNKKGNIKDMMPKIDNSGQVLLLVTIALAVLVGVGISISNQTLSSITRTSQSDSLQKVTAAAEGALERYLLMTDETLATKVGATNLIENFPASNTKALVTVENITATNGLTFPEVSVGQVATFFLSNDVSTMTFTGQVTCLKFTTDTPNPDYMLNVVVKNPTVTVFQSTTPAITLNYDATTSNNFLMEKYIYKSGTFTNGVAPASSGCPTNSYSFTNAALVRIHPLSQSLKNLKIEIASSGISGLASVRQGYKITSLGSFSTGDDKTTRKINASKYLDAPDNVFDFTAFIDY